MNNTLLRGISGLVFISTIIIPILISPLLSACIFSFYALVGLYEYNKLTKSYTIGITQQILMYTFALTQLTLPILNYQFNISNYANELTLIFCVFWLIINLFNKEKLQLETSAVKFFGLAYTLAPIILLTNLNYNTENKLDLIGIFVLVWSNDTFAYLIGSQIGKTKLFERISPKKTWEGTIGGILMTIIVAIIWHSYFSELPALFWMICAVLMSLSAIFGDLFESQLKRQFGVKDSGKLIPGHGGVLDRFDASLFAFTLYYVLWTFYH